MLETGVRVLRLLTAAVTARPLSPLRVHEQLAAAWKVPTEQAPMLRAALVLSADHEFNASAFAARVVASTGANLYGATTAGLAALNGPRHGGLTRRVAALFEELKGTTTSMPTSATGCAPASSFRASATSSTPMATSARRPCSHSCARQLPHSPELAFAERLAAAVERLIGRKANIDFATVTVERVLGLPKRFGPRPLPAGPYRRVDRTCPGASRTWRIDPAARALYRSATRKLRPAP